ncbi:MAG TPA: amino acid permease [Candidatus Eremiobacteraceae bacterium]|nr:amino acid permease [Candidatus Eremiobacteraceae bacterium]
MKSKTSTRDLLRRIFAVQPLTRLRKEEEGQPKLRRVLGIPALIAIGLGTMLGGIFTTMGVGAAAAGPGVIMGFALSGIACIFVALCYAEFASMVPVAGSAYTYAYATLGEFVAWVIGWDLILEYGISAAPVASSWSGSAQDFLRSLGVVLPPWAQTAKLDAVMAPAQFGPWHFNMLHAIRLGSSQVDVIACLVVLAISILLAIGIKESAGTNAVFVGLQVMAFILFIVGCWSVVSGKHLHPFAPFGFHGIVQSAALVFFAYIGFDTVTVASEESRNPQRDIPIAVIGSLIIGGILYMTIAYITVGVVPWQHIESNSALSQAARLAHNNPWFYNFVTLGAIAGNISVMLTSLLGQSRIFYVMARDGLLPPVVARVHPRFRTPARMTMITGVIVAMLAAVVPLEKLLELVNIGTLSAFSIVCLGVLILRYTRPDAKRPFKAPLGPLVALCGLFSCLYLTFQGLALATWIRFVVWFAVGAVIYFFYGYRHSFLAAAHAETDVPHFPGVPPQEPEFIE